MLSRYGLRRVTSALLVSLIGVAGCQRNQPPGVAPKPAKPEAFESAFTTSNWTYHLRPLKADAPADADNAKKVWRDLFTGMAKDEQTRELLTRLHAGLPVEFIVMDAKEAEDKAALGAPPSEGVAIAMRVADLRLKEEEWEAGVVPIRYIAYAHVIHIQGAAPPNSWKESAAALKKEPLPGEPLDLAMEDYLLRHAPGWVVLGGPPFVSGDEKIPASVEDQRRALDQKIKEHVDRATAYYGAIK